LVEPVVVSRQGGSQHLEPLIDSRKSGSCEPAGSSSSVDSTNDEPGTLEDFQVSGDGGLRHIERFRQFHDGRFAGRETSEDGATRRVGQGKESGIKLRRRPSHITDKLYNTHVIRDRSKPSSEGHTEFPGVCAIYLTGPQGWLRAGQEAPATGTSPPVKLHVPRVANAVGKTAAQKPANNFKTGAGVAG
jgi:hypothetical protein